MIDENLAKTFLVKFESVDHLVDWVHNFFEIRLPSGHVDPKSNSSPAEWMYDVYSTYRDNKGDATPGFIVLSSRDSYKTLTESMLAVILMIHFGATIAHLAAIESQASKAVQYVNNFVKKIEGYLAKHNLNLDTQSKRRVAITTQTGDVAYVNVIIATVQGCNSEHTNILSVDELDVMRFPQAFDEAKMIPAVFNGTFPITLMTSTRKYAFGVMSREWDNAEAARFKKLRWNILDVSERCPSSRHLPKEKKVTRYIHPQLPLSNLSKAEMEKTSKPEEYEKIKAYAGCAECPLLPVCKMKLAHRPATDTGGLYKPISHVINLFRKISPDMATAQLLCERPSQAGLIYGRFDDAEETGNTLTIQQAYKQITGTKKEDATLEQLVAAMKALGHRFYAGVDWGFRHFFAITVSSIVGKEWWHLDTHAVAGLEFEQMIDLAIKVKTQYKPAQWFCDTANPMFIKAFRRRGMPCKNFKKDVAGGIECVRGQIVDATGNRFLKVIKHERNKFLIEGFHRHHYLLDAAGKPTQEPDDEEYADVMDSIRYQGQNLFAGKTKTISPTAQPEQLVDAPRQIEPAYEDWLAQKLRHLTGQSSVNSTIKSQGGTFIADFGDPKDDEET